MFQKRKKFVEETTPEQRLADRWEQQVFFITRKHPHSQAGISAIVKKYSARQEDGFIPSEEALNELTNLSLEL